ncbi:MAG TPA: serine/threonine-protein kinase [Polyangiaceae bacterium]|nr:serine/threonine-protein kinase [Polyangiaceae bacterium]
MVEPRARSNPPLALGKYTPFARLGHGGMADVYLAAARGLVGFNKLVVIKRMRDSGEPAFVQMFLDEARLTARLNHPNVVHIYEVGEVDGTYFIAMEYLDGQSLDSISRALEASSMSLSEAFAAYIIVQALKGLHYAHQLTDYDGSPLGIVHRDCSPQNLFVTYTGQVKVLDFGIAKAASNQTHTEAGMLKGKVRYMAPEQMMGAPVDRRADVFSMGVVLWQLLAGCRLFSGDTYETMHQLREPAPSVHSVRPEVSAALESIVAKALQRDPKQRYESAEAMQLALEQFVREQPPIKEGDLGEFVAELFVDRRVEVRDRIQKYLALVPTHDTDSSGLVGFAIESSSLPRLISNEGTPSAERIPVRSAIETLAPPKPSRARQLAAGAAALLLVTAGALKLSQRAPIANAPAPLAAAPSAMPELLRANITSSPPGALIEWNGRPLDRTPAGVELTGKAQTVILTLEGYFPESLVVHPLESGGVSTYQVTLRARTPALPSVAALPPASPRQETVPRHYVRPTSHDSRGQAPVTAPTSAATATATARPNVRVIEDIPVIDEIKH